jgi:hypothetical protein
MEKEKKGNYRKRKKREAVTLIERETVAQGHRKQVCPIGARGRWQ